MPRHRSVITIPPALPDRMPEPRKPPDVVSEVARLTRVLYNEETEEGAQMRRYLNTVNREDSVTGDYKFDHYEAAKLIQQRALAEHSFISALKPLEIKKKLQFGLKRHDTPELPFSRQARLKLLEHQS